MTEASLLTHWEGEPVQVWARLWQVPLLEAHDRLASTNDRARALALEGAKRFTTVIAEEQTAGRGRSGRRWASPPGQGLWMSTLVSGQAEQVSPLTPVLVGVALIRAIRSVVPALEPGLKWPNDLYAGGRKVAGVLCESLNDGRRVIVGLGINVRQTRDDFPPELRESAASLEMASGGSVSRGRLAGAVMSELRALFSDLPFELTGALAAEVRRMDILAGRQVSSSTGLQGQAHGFGPDGALRIRDAEGREHRVHAGSVRLTNGEAFVRRRDTKTDGA